MAGCHYPTTKAVIVKSLLKSHQGVHTIPVSSWRLLCVNFHRSNSIPLSSPLHLRKTLLDFIFTVRVVGPTKFHPISISYAPHEDIVTLHICGWGDWSCKLAKLAEKGEQEVNILLEGPYGSLLVINLDNFSRYKHVMLLVCGDIGVTQCISVGKALQYQTKMGRSPASVGVFGRLRLGTLYAAVGRWHGQENGTRPGEWQEVYCSRLQPVSEDLLPGDSKTKQEVILIYGDLNIVIFVLQ